MDEYDDLPEVDALLRAEKKHEWISEPRFKRMFNEIEDGLQGVLGKGKYEWVAADTIVTEAKPCKDDDQALFDGF